MGTKISKQTRRELLEALRERYRNASKIDKTKILDEFIDIAGCHRKHAIRLLTGVDPVMPEAPRLGRRIYSEAVRQALVVLWEAADRICGKRLKAILPGLISAMERHGHLTLDPNVRQLLLAASPATIDRLLAPIRGTAGHRRKRKSTTKSSREIPVRTFADWKEPAPGFLEMDFVAHGGDSMQGTFLWSLVATDVCSGWTEAVALVAREQSLVVEGLEVIRRQFPVPVLGIDSDNDSAFINETLQGYCKEQQIEFTRSRPYQKNDQAWIEQKNGSVIRRFVGYRRFSGLIAGQCLARLYRMVRLYVNYFQPSFKLLLQDAGRGQDQEAVSQAGDPLRTSPGSRLGLGRGQGSPPGGTRPARSGGAAASDPRGSSRPRRARLGRPEPRPGAAEPGGVPGQAPGAVARGGSPSDSSQCSPLHRARGEPGRTRSRRSGRRSFLWLQHDPDSTAKSLMERLHRAYPGRFPDGQLRTLQRRIREWRHVMARSLVHGIRDGNGADEPAAWALSGVVRAPPCVRTHSGAFFIPRAP